MHSTQTQAFSCGKGIQKLEPVTTEDLGLLQVLVACSEFLSHLGRIVVYEGELADWLVSQSNTCLVQSAVRRRERSLVSLSWVRKPGVWQAAYCLSVFPCLSLRALSDSCAPYFDPTKRATCVTVTLTLLPEDRE